MASYAAALVDVMAALGVPELDLDSGGSEGGCVGLDERCDLADPSPLI